MLIVIILTPACSTLHFPASVSAHQTPTIPSFISSRLPCSSNSDLVKSKRRSPVFWQSPPRYEGMGLFSPRKSEEHPESPATSAGGNENVVVRVIRSRLVSNFILIVSAETCCSTRTPFSPGALSTERTRGKGANHPPCHISRRTYQRHKLYRGRTHIPTHPLCQARLHGVRTLNKVWLVQVLLLRESSAILNQQLHHPGTLNAHIPVHLICYLRPHQSRLRLQTGNGRGRKRKKQRLAIPRLNPRCSRLHRHGKLRTPLRRLSSSSRFAR